MLGRKGVRSRERTGHITLALSIVFVMLCQRAGAAPAAQVQQTLSLAGQWQFAPDPEGVGEKDRWFEKDLEHSLRLPGSMAENGYGEEVTVDTKWTGSIVDRSWFTTDKYATYRRPGNVKVPFWLTPKKHYIGAAWYQKEISIPPQWDKKRIVLFLERCHWETTLWVDGKAMGSRNSLSTPHEYDLGALGSGKHRLAIRVDNSLKINVGRNAHSVSDHTQTNWNGIIGAIELRATDAVWIDDVQVYPDLNAKSAKVRVKIDSDTGTPPQGELTVRAVSFNSPRQHNPAEKRLMFGAQRRRASVELDYPMGEDVLLWDEFAPSLYKLTVSISGDRFADEKAVIFGMRKFGSDGTQFTINGKERFVRGTLECCIFPLTGYPPTDVASWVRNLQAAKAHGLNHLRFHSWCPPEAAFAAADQMGFTYQIECAAWATIGDGAEIDKFVYAESDRILKAYGNHPSFCMLAYGNEPGGKNQRRFLGDLIRYWKDKDDRRVYTGAAGWPIIPQNDYHSTPAPRGHQWGAALRSRFNAQAPSTDVDYTDFISRYRVPIVSHEIGQWCVYPNLEEIAKYTGVLQARNFEIFRDSLREHNMPDQAKDFLMASGKLQTLLYKEEIETALRTPGFGGFQLLDLHDFPGQGTALVGVLDPFWESKGYVEPEQFHAFCSETVPLLRMRKFVWTKDELFEGHVEIAHFGPEPMRGAVIGWSAKTVDGRAVAMGEFQPKDIPLGNGTTIGRIAFTFGGVTAPAKLEVQVKVEAAPYRNTWDIWVYPSTVDTSIPENVLVTETWDKQTRTALAGGKTVLLMPPPDRVAGNVPPGFTTIFWNTQWTRHQPPHTLGILCDPQHPALAQFPTQFHSNWQWWDLVTKSRFMILDDFGPDLRPIVQVIDDWNTNRKLALVFEAKLDQGKLLVCSTDLWSNLENRPAARQMLHSLLRYAASEAFRPACGVTAEQIGGLFRKPTAAELLGAKVVRVDSEEPDSRGSQAIDGDADTFWHTAWRGQTPGYPHSIEIALAKTVSVKGLRYLPRQDMTNGWIGDYELYVSNRRGQWGKPVAKGRFDPGRQWQTARIGGGGNRGRFVRFVALSPLDPAHRFAAAAELDIITE